MTPAIPNSDSRFLLVLSAMISKDDSHWITTGNFAKKPAENNGDFPSKLYPLVN